MDRTEPIADVASPRPTAWLWSAAGHLVALLLAAWLIRLPGPVASPESSDRPVHIVLAPPPAAGQPFASAAATNPAAASATATAPPPADLPEAADLAALPEIDLPGETAATSEGLLTIPAAAGRQRMPRMANSGEADFIAAEQAARRAAARGLQGDPVELSVFGLGVTGRSFVFLLDRSQSMGTEGLNFLAAAQDELHGCLRDLQPRHRFTIIAYNDQPLYLSRELLPGDDLSRGKALKFLAGLSALSATEHEAAIKAALRARPDVLVLLTDGGDPPISPGTLRRVAERNGGRTVIHTIEVGAGPLRRDDSPLRQLAEDSGGMYAYLDVDKLPR